MCREVVLSKIDGMVKDFVYKASLSRGLSESIASTSGGKIFSFVSLSIGSCFCQNAHMALVIAVFRDLIDWGCMDLGQTLTLSV